MSDIPQPGEHDIKELIDFAKNLKEQGVAAEDIRTALAEKGLNDEQKTVIMQVMNQESASEIYHSEELEEDDTGGTGIPKFVWYLLGLGLINLLSYLFDWPFWIY